MDFYLGGVITTFFTGLMVSYEYGELNRKRVSGSLVLGLFWPAAWAYTLFMLFTGKARRISDSVKESGEQSRQ